MSFLRKHSVDLALFLVVLFWAVSPSLFKFALEEMDPFAFIYARFLLITALAVVILWTHGRRGGRAWRFERRDVLPLIISGLSGYGIYQFFYQGLRKTPCFSTGDISGLAAVDTVVWYMVSYQYGSTN